MVLVDTPSDTCIARATSKKFDVPFPAAWSSPVEDTIRSLEGQLTEDHVKLFWEIVGKCPVIVYRNVDSIEDLIGTVRGTISQKNRFGD